MDKKKTTKFDIIFLDIDGVMATYPSMARGWEYRRKHKNRRLKYSEFIKDKLTIDRKCIKSLNKLVVRTNAKVVISSAWRYDYSVRYFQRLFKSRGFCGEVIGKTPVWNEYKDSIGIKAEMEYATEKNKPIRILDEKITEKVKGQATLIFLSQNYNK